MKEQSLHLRLSRLYTPLSNYDDLSTKRLFSEILSGEGRKSQSIFALRLEPQLRWIKSYYLRVTRERDDITSIPNIFVLLDIRWNFPPNEMSGRSPLIRFREELFSFFGEIQFRLRSQILSWNDLPRNDEKGRRLIKTLSKSAFFNESGVRFLFSSLDFI